MVQASKPYKELLWFTNTIHLEPRQDVEQELSELATASDRWFSGLRRFIETEPDLDLPCVYLGRD